MRPKSVTVLPLALGVALLAPVAKAEEARIPLYKVTTITQPGSYFVTRDFSGSPAISVQANDVTIDLHGHTIGGTSGLSSPIELQDGYSGLTLRDGLVANAVAGGGIASLGTSVPVRMRVEGVTFQNLPGTGIVVMSASNVVVENCIFNSVQGHGIYVASSTAGSVRVVDNQFSALKSSGVSISTTGSVYVARNTITSFGQGSPNESGIYVSAASPLIEDNVIRQGTSDDHGIRVIHGALVRNNTVTGCGNGITVEGASTVVDGNALYQNSCGLKFSITTSAYRNNILRGNTTAVCGAASTDAGGNIL